MATCVASAAARLRAAAPGLPASATPMAEGSVVSAGLLAKPGVLFVIVGFTIPSAMGAGGGVSQAAPPPPPLPPASLRRRYCSPRHAATARTPAEVTPI